MTGAICGGTAAYIRRVRECPNEGKRRRFVGRFTSLWYPVDWTCLGCGDSFSSEGRRERPFARGWRQEAMAKARRDWTASFAFPDGMTVVRAEMEASRAADEPTDEEGEPRTALALAYVTLIWLLRNNGGECPSDYPHGYNRALRTTLDIGRLLDAAADEPTERPRMGAAAMADALAGWQRAADEPDPPAPVGGPR